MLFRRLMSSAAVAALTLLVPLTAPSAQAQGLFEFLWGGGKEWGGSRQTVSFNPKYTPGQIIVSFGDRRLYLITKTGTALSYPIAAPREQSRWQGATSVTSKRENPSWRPTPEMLRENPRLPSWVPGGHPQNPLGVRALYLGSSLYRIHGTDAPWTIGQAVSKGCIRMLNEDVLDLYPRIPVGTKVTVTWERFNGQTFASSDQAPDPTPVAPLRTARSEGTPPAYRPAARPVRNLAPSAAAQAEAMGADTESRPLDQPKPVKLPKRKPEAVSAAPVAAASPEDTLAIAERAAATAARAAEAAKRAAEAAKKAAEAARRASADQAEEEKSASL
ncbi:L,D-transpeptidase [Hyphomicrobium sulfonivorans]|uniref:L,D-transpeptidase n=1 Tax=Hyphomicrobium sulfonivorans TaxID=121290 RepID=UPI001FEB22E0|nr:L,D-transpeptidase [Hyphomicrobium sulfonivorans]